MRALVLDLDGLIVDTERPAYLSWCEVYAAHGVEFDLELWATCIGTEDTFDPVERLAALTGRPVDRDAVRAARRAANRRLLDAEPVRPGVRELVGEARREGLRLAIASTSPRAWVERILSAHGLLDAFEHLACGDEVAAVKPAPDLYRAALRGLGVSSEDAVAVEDSPNGVAAAKAAGLRCVAVPNPLTVRLDLSAADLTVGSLAGWTLDRLSRALEAIGGLPALCDGTVLLRPMTADDAQEHLDGEDDEQVRWLSGGVGSMTTVQPWIERNLRSWRDGGDIRCFGVRDAATDALVGMADARVLPSLDRGDRNLSYGVYPAYRKRGTAVRAVELICRYLCASTDARRAVIRTDTGNVASQRVALRAGFEPAGGPDADGLLRFMRDLRGPGP